MSKEEKYFSKRNSFATIRGISHRYSSLYNNKRYLAWIKIQVYIILHLLINEKKERDGPIAN